MPRADQVAAVRRRGKLHTYIAVTPGEWSASTNTVTAATERRIDAYGVYPKSRETAVSGVAVLQGDEILTIDATPLQSAGVLPKAGDVIEDDGDATYQRAIVAFEPVRGTDSAIWFYRLLLRGPIDAE